MFSPWTRSEGTLELRECRAQLAAWSGKRDESIRTPGEASPSGRATPGTRLRQRSSRLQCQVGDGPECMADGDDILQVLEDVGALCDPFL
jgi:hypothetical protein